MTINKEQQRVNRNFRSSELFDIQMESSLLF